MFSNSKCLNLIREEGQHFPNKSETKKFSIFLNFSPPLMFTFLNSGEGPCNNEGCPRPVTRFLQFYMLFKREVFGNHRNKTRSRLCNSGLYPCALPEHSLAMCRPIFTNKPSGTSCMRKIYKTSVFVCVCVLDAFLRLKVG